LGRVVFSAIPILMMGVAPIYFLCFHMDMMSDGMKQYGFPAGDLKLIVILEICCGLIYAIPQTAVLGAILMTGYLGGAVATHLRAGELPKAAMPVIFGVFVWLGLLPFRR
jgi:DoxX-like family